jgi:hypothetical protein
VTKSTHSFWRHLTTAAAVVLVCVAACPVFGQQVRRGVPAAAGAQEGPAPGDDQVIRVFKLAHSDAETMARVLNQTVPGLSVAVDQVNNAIVVASANKQASQSAEALIERLDALNPSERGRASAVSVRLAWLVEGDEGGNPPAENLKSVVDELHHQGLKNLVQVAQAMVRSQYGNAFHISCSPSLDNRPTELSAQGTILPGGELDINVVANRPGGPEASLPAGAGMQPEFVGPMMGAGAAPAGRMPPGAPMPQSSVTVAERLTEVHVHTVFKPGEYIVLAVAPIGKITSVFVIQINETGR